jgi:cytochrome oxidase assembly protein ShyY1
MVGIGVTSALARCFIVCITFITSILGWLAGWLCGRPKEVMKVMQTMKQRAKAEVTPIPTIYEEELIRHTTKRTTTKLCRCICSSL